MATFLGLLSLCFTGEVFLLVLGFIGVEVLATKAADSLQVADSEVLLSDRLNFTFVAPHEEELLPPKQIHSCQLGAYQH